MSLKSNIIAASLMSAVVIVGSAATALAGPMIPTGATASAKDELVVKVSERYRKRYGHRHYKRKRYARRYRRDCCVDAPYTYVDGYRGDVEVDAPFAYVNRHRGGVHVRAPFVDLYIPR